MIAVAAFLAIMTVQIRISSRRSPASGADAEDASKKNEANPVRVDNTRHPAAQTALPSMRRWVAFMAVFVAVALIVALPMIRYISNPDAYYWTHFDNYSDVRITRTPQYAAAGTWERIGLVAGQAKYFASAYAWHGRLDNVDGNGLRPVFDPFTLALICLGLVLAWRYRRRPAVIAALCAFAIVPLPAVLQKGSIMREPVGAAPYAMFLAALPLAALWRAGMRHNGWRRLLPPAVAFAALAVIAGVTVHDYFWTARTDPWVRAIYFSEETSASIYMRGLPADSYIYFYSDRAPLSSRRRQFLAPDIRGEDRSQEFAGAASFPDINPARRSVFIVMGRYAPLLTEIKQRYPGGSETIERRDGKFEFAAYVSLQAPRHHPCHEHALLAVRGKSMREHERGAGSGWNTR